MKAAKPRPDGHAGGSDPVSLDLAESAWCRGLRDGKTGDKGRVQSDRDLTHVVTGQREVAVRVWLAAPFAEDSQAKAAGARWDSRAKSWYAP